MSNTPKRDPSEHGTPRVAGRPPKPPQSSQVMIDREVLGILLEIKSQVGSLTKSVDLLRDEAKASDEKLRALLKENSDKLITAAQDLHGIKVGVRVILASASLVGFVVMAVLAYLKVFH